MYDIEVIFKDNENIIKHFKCEEVVFEDSGTLLETGDNFVYLPNHTIHHLIAERIE